MKREGKWRRKSSKDVHPGGLNFLPSNQILICWLNIWTLQHDSFGTWHFRQQNWLYVALNTYLLFMAHGSSTHLSTVEGFGPRHCSSGSPAIAPVSSKYILHSTSLLLMPSPQVTLHGPHFSGMKLKEEWKL